MISTPSKFSEPKPLQPEAVPGKSKVKCTNCGASILRSTFHANHGLCVPCFKGLDIAKQRSYMINRMEGQPPNYRNGDFVDVYPHSLVVCTELPSSFFSSDEGKYWLIANRNIAVGSFLGIQSRDEVDAFMTKLKINTFICADCSMSEITSGSIDTHAIKLVTGADNFVRSTGITVENRQHRIVPMLCEDTFKKTSWVRYCWFFE